VARFSLPAGYAKMRRRGLFDYFGAPAAGLSSKARARLLKRREQAGQVLLLDEVEWLAPEAVVPVEGVDYWTPGLVPFASTPAGDLYCWYLPWQGGAAEPPVLLCDHEAATGEVVAVDFAGFVYRVVLVQLSCCWWQGPAEGAERAVGARLGRLVDAASPFVSREQRAALASLAARRPGRDGGGPFRVLAAAELATLIAAVGLPERAQPLACCQPPTRYTLPDEQAIGLYPESVGYYEAMSREHPALRLPLAEALSSLGQAEARLGRAEAASASLARAISVFETIGDGLEGKGRESLAHALAARAGLAAAGAGVSHEQAAAMMGRAARIWETIAAERAKGLTAVTGLALAGSLPRAGKGASARLENSYSWVIDELLGAGAARPEHPLGSLLARARLWRAQATGHPAWQGDAAPTRELKEALAALGGPAARQNGWLSAWGPEPTLAAWAARARRRQARGSR
jgi:hypothetical protein